MISQLACVRSNTTTLQVQFCFHSHGHHHLPKWVLDEAISNPNILYNDRSGRASKEYLTLGIDEGIVLLLMNYNCNCSYDVLYCF
jgi:hypothetical protein